MEAGQRYIWMNSSSPLGDAWKLFCLGRKSRKHARNGRWRFTWPILIALLVFSGFAVASIGVSSICTSGDKALVPLEAGNCGLYNYTTGTPAGLTAVSSKILADTREAQTWVDKCYGSTPDPLYCTAMIKDNLNYSAAYAACPWPGNRCAGGTDAAWHMESQWINSASDLGINAPEANRVDMKIVKTCSVLNTGDVMTEVIDHSTNGSFIFQEFYFGAIPGVSNYTFRYPTHARSDNTGYGLTSVPFNPRPGFEQPIPQMTRYDGDLTMMFFAAGSVTYLETSADLLYTANGTSTRNGFIVPDDYVKVIACHEQYQFRNPVGNLTSALTSLYNVLDLEPPNLNYQQQATLLRMFEALLYSDAYWSVEGLDGSALLAYSQVVDFISPAQPPGAWQSEMESWFKLGLAKVSRYILDFPQNNNFQENEYVARNSGNIQNFSVLGIALIILLSLLLIILSLTLGWCVRRRKKDGNVTEFAYSWLQLIRMALEARGYSDWESTDTANPVRTIKDRDIEAPVLKNGQIEFPQRKGNETSDGEGTSDDTEVGEPAGDDERRGVELDDNDEAEEEQDAREDADETDGQASQSFLLQPLSHPRSV